MKTCFRTAFLKLLAENSGLQKGMGEKKTKKDEKKRKIGTFSRKLGQDGVFTLRECAQSISRIKLPPIGSFLRKKFFRFPT